MTEAGFPEACSGDMYPGEPMIGSRLGQPAPVEDTLGQSEVGDVRPALVIEQDVGRLEVAVEDPALVRVVHGRGDLGHEPRDDTGIPGQPRLGRGKAAAGQERHAEIMQPVVLPDLEDRHDIRMFERSDDLRFVLESEQVLPRGEPAVEYHLQCDQTAWRELSGLINDAHTPAADLGEDLVTRHAWVEKRRRPA